MISLTLLFSLRNIWIYRFFLFFNKATTSLSHQLSRFWNDALAGWVMHDEIVSPSSFFLDLCGQAFNVIVMGETVLFLLLLLHGSLSFALLLHFFLKVLLDHPFGRRIEASKVILQPCDDVIYTLNPTCLQQTLQFALHASQLFLCQSIGCVLEKGVVCIRVLLLILNSQLD